MDVSSVSAPAPVTPVASGDSQPPSDATANPNGNNSAYQPPSKAPLPPGQGTRIDQIA